MESEEATSPTGRRPYASLRSANSINWRVKDGSPRSEQPQQRRNDAPRFQNRDNNNGYGHPGSIRTNSYNRQPRDPADVPTEVTTPRLYVGNLLYSAQPSDIENFFIANGFKPANLSMSIDSMTGRNPSYCFVDLETVDDAKQAIEELNGKEILGRAVRINPGVAKKEGGPTGRDASRVKTFEGGRSPWRDGNTGDKEQSSYKPTYDRWKSGDISSQPWSRPQEQGKRLYVGGLPHIEPQSAVDAAMQDLFSGFALNTVSKIISPHPSKASEPGDHYYLFVDLANIDDVDAAIEKLNDSASPFGESDESRLKVNRARDNQGKKPSREQGDRQGQGQTFNKPSWRDQ